MVIKIEHKRLWVCPKCKWKNIARDNKFNINTCPECKFKVKIKLR